MAEKSMKLTGKPVKNTPLVPADMLFILDSEDSDAIKRVPQTSFKGEKGDDGAPGPGISVKGSKDTVGDLPIGAEAGDAYVVRENGDLYISDGAENWAVADITGFVYKGSWDGATEYEPDDVVTYDGSAYFCILGGNMGELPDTPGSIYWTLFLSKGADGADGADGQDGKTLLSGIVDPTVEGVDGDFYINTATWQIFGPKDPATGWGAGTDLVGSDGADGADGADGRTIWNGTGDPAAPVGSEGDFYINTSTWQIFGPKDVALGWGSGIDLLGADGTDGADGASSYTAIAYADDDSGTGFTMTFDPSKDYIAIKTSSSPIPENPEQFAGLWKYYAGGSAPAVENAPEGLYTCDTGETYGVHLITSGIEYTLPLTQVIGDGLALGEYADSVVVDYDKAAFYRCLHNICGNIKPDKPCTLTLKLYQDDVLQRSRTLKVFESGADFTPVLMVLNYITEGVTGSTEIMLTLSADIDDVWAEVEDLNHNMTFRSYTAYIFSYLAGVGGSISGDAYQTVAEGADGTSVTAVPAEGYAFSSWSDGILTAARQDLNAAADITVTASFTVVDELPEGAFLDEEGGALIDEEESFFIDGE